MNKFGKTTWATDGNTVRVGMDFAKVDKQRRLVSGFATLDNVDTQNDIVLAEASLRAFQRARGNLREMHQPIAVGKVVDFEEREFFNPEDGKTYKGIFVTARVSEGAQDTWLKVLDGTLTGFSIGGSVIDSESVYKDAGSVHVIKDYDLTELSLVDNPANQLSNIKTIHKVMEIGHTDDGSVTVSGMIAEQSIENVFYCKEDNIAIHKSASTDNCPVCHGGMNNIGFYENGGDSNSKVKDIVTKYLAADEGGVINMGTENNAVEENEVVEVEESPEESESTEEEAVEPEVEETEESEENEEIEEAEDDSEVISKAINDLKEVVTNSLEKVRDENKETVQTIEKKITELTDTFEQKTNEFEERLVELGTKLDFQKGKLAELEKNVSKMKSSGAIKKSGEAITPVPEQDNDDFWKGAFSLKSTLS